MYDNTPRVTCRLSRLSEGGPRPALTFSPRQTCLPSDTYNQFRASGSAWTERNVTKVYKKAVQAEFYTNMRIGRIPLSVRREAATLTLTLSTTAVPPLAFIVGRIAAYVTRCPVRRIGFLPTIPSTSSRFGGSAGAGGSMTSIRAAPAPVANRDSKSDGGTNILCPIGRG